MIAARRFYKDVFARAEEGGYAIYLDARRLRTPANKPALLPAEALAQAVAAEWDRQETTIEPLTMPITRLSFAALDGAEARRGEIVAEIGKFAETDLVCHRAASPETLVRRQSAAWNPWLEWSRQTLQHAPAVTTGFLPAPPDEAGIAALKARAEALDPFRLIALSQGVSLTGSAVLGFALLAGALSAEGAFQAAALDDLFQIETWGEDSEARARLQRLRMDIADLSRFVDFLA